MTCSELECVFFTPVKEIILPPPCLIASMSLQLFYQMEKAGEQNIQQHTASERPSEIKRMCVSRMDGGQEGKQCILEESLITK